MWELSTFAIYMVVLFGAAVFMSITGFGFGMISTTVLFLIFPPQDVVHALAFPFITATFFAFVRNRKHIPWSEIVPYALYALPGVLVATWIHLLIPTFAFQLFLSLLLFYAVFHSQLPAVLGFILRTPISASLAGFANGVLGTAGPPVIAWSVIKPWSTNVRRAATVTIFLIAGGFRTVVLCFEPTFMVNVQLTHCLALAPGIFIGVWVGTHLSKTLKGSHVNLLHRTGILVLAWLLLGRSLLTALA